MTINIKELWHKFINFLSRTTNGMAIGLFGTLIIGVIMEQIGKVLNISEIVEFSKFIKSLMGAGIGIGVSLTYKKDPIYTITGLGVGYLSASNLGRSFQDPLSSYIGIILAFGIISLIMRRKTPIDILLIPFIGLLVAVLYSWFVSYYIHFVTQGIGMIIENAMNFDPRLSILMTIIISVVMGMALTAPISSAAIAITINLNGVAAGAALIGCSVQMIGFAVQMWRDNKAGNIIAVAIGTSMLQFKNIIKKPLIWLPTIIVSALLGPFALLFNITTSPVGAGMGTSGLVGFITAFESMGYTAVNFIILASFTIFIPAVLVFILDLIFYKLNWIKKGDLAIDSEENTIKVDSDPTLANNK